MLNFDFAKICSQAMSALSDRQKAIIEKRFGLLGNEPHTLQQIGDFFHITRERVRQIEKDSLNVIRRDDSKEIVGLFSALGNYLRSFGGLKKSDLILNDLGGEKGKNYIFFFLVLSGEFVFNNQGNDNFDFWALNSEISKSAKKTIVDLVSLFKENKKIMDLAEIENIFSLPREFLLSCLEIAKEIERGALGGYGLISWPEIAPRGVKDMAFLVLKKNSSPIHFKDIASLANKMEISFNKRRKILPQTIHNELIRDARFVLVGRGIYGLKEWGYQPGTVKEVILKVLESSDGPMGKKEIFEEVSKHRIVQANTVFLNLANKNLFQRDENGLYKMKGIDPRHGGVV